MSGGQWFMNGAVLSNLEEIASLYVRGSSWQLYTTCAGGYALAVADELYAQWIRRDFLEEGLMAEEGSYHVITASSGEMISSVEFGPFGQTVREANAFASALKASMERMSFSLTDGIFVERFGLILPVFPAQGKTDADCLLGRWLCGGMNISLTDTERIRRYVPWLGDVARKALLNLFGLEEGAGGDDSVLVMPSPFDPSRKEGMPETPSEQHDRVSRKDRKPGPFTLPGRKELETFLRDHILDVIDREEEYKRFGVGFPGATLLHGPSGSGKTFAVEKLADYLGWPVFRITSGTVGSKYIHETSRKISGVFDAAVREAPSVLIIDEMEAFLSSRESASGNPQAHLEEVGEFLRRIPEAPENHVLLFGMTNRMSSIDSAILRKGRFDYIIPVSMPSAEEVFAVLDDLLGGLPTEGNLRLDLIAESLAGHPLSDAAFVVKEAGRICVRAGRTGITRQDLQSAAALLDTGSEPKRRIGFS